MGYYNSRVPDPCDVFVFVATGYTATGLRRWGELGEIPRTSIVTFNRRTSFTLPPQRPPDWIARWQRVARRIRVPLGFLTAALYLFELGRRAPLPAAVAWSLALVLPGLWLRGYAAGYVKKNRELTVTGPYAHTRNPLYLGSMLIAAGFAVALLSWPVALVLAVGFAESTFRSSPRKSAFCAPHFPPLTPIAAAFPD